MARQIVFTSKAAKPPAADSQAVIAAGLVFVSGTTPVSPETGRIEGTTIQEQTAQCLANIRAILEEAGSSMEKLASVTVVLASKLRRTKCFMVPVTVAQSSGTGPIQFSRRAPPPAIALSAVATACSGSTTSKMKESRSAAQPRRTSEARESSFTSVLPVGAWRSGEASN